MTRVGIFGAAGRMGSTMATGIDAAPDCEVVALVDPAAAGRVVAGAAGELIVADDPAALTAAGAEVAVDFTRADAAIANLRWCAANGVHGVCGTSGLGEPELEELGELFPAEGGGPNCAWVPNFALGAVLMMHVAELVAPHMDGVEIIELHHDGKVDAPSGTAAATARRLASARGTSWPADRTTRHTVEGARGGEGDGAIRIHSVRLPGLVASQEVIFGALGQTLTIRHDTYDRGSFVPGVLLAVRGIAGRPGLTVGLDHFLGL